MDWMLLMTLMQFPALCVVWDSSSFRLKMKLSKDGMEGIGRLTDIAHYSRYQKKKWKISRSWYFIEFHGVFLHLPLPYPCNITIVF